MRSSVYNMQLLFFLGAEIFLDEVSFYEGLVV
jgi:hypothetical protein